MENITPEMIEEFKARGGNIKRVSVGPQSGSCTVTVLKKWKAVRGGSPCGFILKVRGGDGEPFYLYASNQYGTGMSCRNVYRFTTRICTEGLGNNMERILGPNPPYVRRAIDSPPERITVPKTSKKNKTSASIEAPACD